MAINQFDDLLSYLRRRNVVLARRVGRAILAKVDHIQQFPYAQRVAPGLPSIFREAFVKNYRLLYRLVGDDQIRLLSIRHVRQRPLTPSEIMNLE
ncbi:MAG: type II toxin-antitoxin system RelE/ParE family toxin [Ardenticatenaceae bacterium]